MNVTPNKFTQEFNATGFSSITCLFLSVTCTFCSGDEVERSIEFLDKVLSEFEDPDSLPHIEQQEPDTPTQGNQSEDDGYMSMNGKK